MDKPGKLVWNQCLPYGKWKGHENGEVEYGPAECAAILAHFNARYLDFGRAMPIDYDHMTFSGGKSEAAGWIWELAQVEKFDSRYCDDESEFTPGLYMANEWTPTAQGQIEEKKYKYLSPVIVSRAPDPITGAEVPIQLFTVALTNTPFMLDKFTAVKFAAEKHGWTAFSIEHENIHILNSTIITRNAMDPKAMLEEVKTALKLGAEATGEDVLNLIKKLVEFASMFPEGGGEMPEPEEMPELAAAAKNSMTITKGLAALFSCKPEELETKAKAALSSQTPDAKLASEVAELKADALIVKYADRIPATDRAYWKGRAIKDAKDTAELLEKQPVVMNSAIIAPAQKAEDITLTPDQMRICKNMKIDPKKYAATLAAQKSSTN